MAEVVVRQALRHEPSQQAINQYYQALSRFWHPVMRSEELGDEPVAVKLLDQQLVVARLEGQVSAFEDLCRHMGAALSLGQVVDGCRLRCPYHGWTYDADGVCVDIPARRDRAIPQGARVPSYHAAEAYGLVWVCLDPEPVQDIPAFPEYGEPSWNWLGLRSSGEWKASLSRVMMGSIDDTHFAWVHPDQLGAAGEVEAPDHTVTRDSQTVTNTFTLAQAQLYNDVELVDNTYTTYFTVNTGRLLKVNEQGTYFVWIAFCPVSYNRCVGYFNTAHSWDWSEEDDEEQKRLEERVNDEDRHIMESQRPWLLPPLSARLQLFIRPADEPIIEYQRLMDEHSIPQI